MEEEPTSRTRSASPRKAESTLKLTDNAATAGPSKLPSSRRPSRSPAPFTSTYAPTSFTPLPRSLFAGSNIQISRSPSPVADSEKHGAEPSKRQSESRRSGDGAAIVVGDIFIDEIPIRETTPLPDTVHESAEHFDPPGLFSTSLMPTVKPSTSTEEDDPQVELQSARTAPSAGQLQQDKKGKGKVIDSAHDQVEVEGGLLLPSHVLVDTASPIKNIEETDGEDGQGQAGDDDDPMEGVHFVDDDISKGSKRYFDPDEDEPKEVEATFLATADQSKICQNCKRPGHRSKDCKHIICTTCGAEDDHERRDCPVGLVCFGCGGRGHRKQDCPDPASRMSRRTGCDRCGSRDHMENTCHTIWRVYAYRSHDGRTDVQKEKLSAEGWEKEAIGGKASDEWCYNCAREGHLGDDCSKRRGSLARLTAPSAFSYAMSTRGPFAFSCSSRNADLPPPTHSRFDDDEDDYENLPFISGGYKNFAGSNAGKKGREKEKERMRAKERERAALGDSDEEPSWFDGPRRGNQSSGVSIRGRGRGGFSTPNHGLSERDRDRDGGRSAGRRPWDSEYRERTPRGQRDRERERDRDRSRSPRPPSSSSRRDDDYHRGGSRSQTKSDRRRNAQANGKMPFSHNDLMSPSVSASASLSSHSNAPNSAPAKVISFGKLSMPGGPTAGDNDTPTNKGQGRTGGAKSLLNRALGNAMNINSGGNSTPSKGKGKAGSKDSKNGNPLVDTPVRSNSGSKSTSASVTSEDREGGSGSRKKRKRGKRSQDDGHDDGERDWEAEWRKQGNGGGKVEGWGEEFDREEKAAAKAAKEAGGSTAGGLKIKGASNGSAAGGRGKGTSGQKYHGGYT
ncbi:hypothetical protein I317_03272 [Kwoniella heveanensis CBS 569]|nr:hypothetical protein I317_03272 [Kwoniella heveanensis CBS 569]